MEVSKRFWPQVRASSLDRMIESSTKMSKRHLRFPIIRNQARLIIRTAENST